MVRIVVRRKAATSSTGGASSTSSPSSSGTRRGKRKKIPKKPRTTIGPSAVLAYASGRRLVIRFFVVQRRGRWFVADSLTWRTADGTEESGYPKKEEAVRVARYYRDEYGAYCKSPF